MELLTAVIFGLLLEEGDILICTLRGHRFPVEKNIPHLLPEDEITQQEETK